MEDEVDRCGTIKIEHDSSNEWSSDLDASSSEEDFTPVPGLDPGKLNPALKDMVASALSKKMCPPPKPSVNDWKTWDQLPEGVPEVPTEEPKEEEKPAEEQVNLEKLCAFAMPLLDNIFKTTKAVAETKVGDYTEVIRSLESTCSVARQLDDTNTRAYCFVEKMYSSCCHLLSLTKDVHGPKSHLSVKAELLEKQLQTEFSNVLNELRGEEDELSCD